ncbi:MAG: F0F1 ATP synthase subunit B [Firmicutes bacterium]|nr:F0F1 ATP synthase subunit B [Bacillota bacterium]
MQIQLWTLLWQILNLAVMIALLTVVLHKPVAKILGEREERVEKTLAQAAAAQKEAEALLSRYQQQVQNAKQEAQEIVDRATNLGEQMRQEIVRNAESEATRAMTRAKAEITAEKDQALSQIRDEVANLAVLAAGKIIGRSMTVADHEKMVKDFVAELDKVQH